MQPTGDDIRGFVESGGARIFFHAVGEGRPVLFAHAGVADHRMWDRQFADPVPGHRYVRSDMRGYGRSEWVPEAHTPTADVEAVIDHLDLHDVIAVGCSMGGRIALELAVRRPERVGGVVVIGTGLPGWEPPDGGYVPPQWADDILDPLWETKDWPALAALDAEVWLVGVGRDAADVDADLHRRFVEMDVTPLETELERNELFSWAVPNLGERLDEITAPSLVMVGEFDLPDLIDGTGLLAERISDHPRVLIRGAAHLASMERPDAFAAAFRPWLAALGSG